MLAALAWGPGNEALASVVDERPWWVAGAWFTVATLVLSALVRFPLTLWRGWLHERRFGFSQQSLGSFVGDQLKGLAVSVVVLGAVLLGLVGLARALPGWWPAVAAPGAAVLVLLLGFVAPVLLEPIFNRFRPLDDATLAARVRSVCERAGVPVREVLVADASRRTSKLNAYVSGIGATRRVVLFDTLVQKARPEEIDVVVAHELGHRRHRHVLWSTVLSMAGAAAGVLVVWALLGPEVGDPRRVPLVLLIAGALGLAAAPLQSWVSRRWEYDSDRFALEVVGDLGAFESAFVRLSAENLPDPTPPRLVYWWLFSHPTVPERLDAARRAAAAAT